MTAQYPSAATPRMREDRPLLGLAMLFTRMWLLSHAR